MIIKPMLPIWLMLLICVILIIAIWQNKQRKNKKETFSQYRKMNIGVKTAIVLLLFVINLRFMLPNGETKIINSDLNVLFVIDTSVSMRALDYNGNKERLEGVMQDCCYIVDELGGCKFSIITFGNEAQKLIPFTSDGNMVQAELKAIHVEDDFYAQGSSMNLVKDVLEKTLKEEQLRKNGSSKFVVFFVTDGEITKEGETLESFSNMKPYITNGAVLGYGTTKGGKMVRSSYEEEPNSEYYYIDYYDEKKLETITAISKIDEENLKQMASDMGIDYVQMSKQSNINHKLEDIKKQADKTVKTEEKIKDYQDIYYYFAIPLVVLLMINFVIQKRRMV